MTARPRAVIGCTQVHGLKRVRKCNDGAPKIHRDLAFSRIGATRGRRTGASCTTAPRAIRQENHGTASGGKFGGTKGNRNGSATMSLISKLTRSLRITWARSL